MESPLLLYLILTTVTFTDSVQSQTIHASENPLPVGKNVTIFSNTTVTLGTWTFNGNLQALIYPGGFSLSNAKRDRLIFNSSSSSLTIISAQLNDSGVYQLEQLDKFFVQLWLSVQEPISNVTLSAQRTNLVEFNDTAVFNCSVSTGSSLSYEWLAGNSTISSRAGVQLSNGGATLRIVGVTRYDQGSYRCNVSNGLGYEVSPPVYLNISYGPNNATMTVNPVSNMYRSGSNITLSCSVESSPTAMVKWMFNGVDLNQFGLQLHLQNVKENNSGTYKCLFHNTVTMLFSNDSTVIQVMDPLSAVVMRFTNGPAILDEAFTLQCEVTGPIGFIQWWKNGSRITPDKRTMFDNDNKTLTLNPVQFSDGGLYMCQGFNLVSNMTSGHFAVVVNYGPMMPTVMGPKVAKTGDNVTFKCTAESVPPSLYQWHFNGSVVSNMSEYMTPSLTEGMSGEYTCMALNNITGKNSTASITLTLVASIKNVQIHTPTLDALEGYSYNLTCNVTETVDNIYWMKNGERLHPDNNTVFSMDNKKVMFMPVDRYDAGDYECMAMNAVGNRTSSAYMLQVNFGPDNPIIVGPDIAEEGRNAVFNCSAASMPSCTYSWWFNDSLMANTSEFTAGPLAFNMSGSYTCVAHNYVTGMKSKNSTKLIVIEAIHSVMIQSNSTPISNENFTLTCHVVGPYDDLYWMKDDMKLNLNASDPASSMYITEKNILHFTQLTTQSNGSYQCVATNRADHHKSPQYKLLVNYGPLYMKISGPESAKDGANVSLTCTAESYPECDFQWFLNNQSSPLVNGSVISFYATRGQAGKYICIATNPVTNITMEQTKNFAIEDHASANHITNKGAVLLMGLCSVLVHLLLL
ncbi:carcinoembryonic antigen-related cell adhesion molecule 5-like isoform X2 [Gambusia affinis]|uniref:carcinoembryonic antigen-related cell adhesion molecule 5-like isoform X2 n=1 Tax=Gambusia affinis TaxID=33528 RepID=UPI001CDD3A12|nr:carcinoembryonic antigen-related cell adhesion molecule 5-like isoform X2 [Gambusia affinis]